MSNAPITLSYGNFEYKTSVEFLVSLVIAVGVVFLFSMKKFGESTLARDDDDIITQLMPRHLAPREQYSRAHMIYITTMSALVIGLSILGPGIVGQIGGIQVPQSHSALPLFVALVLVGALPNVPWISDLEKALRGWAHKKAFIPTAVQGDARKLQSADFDFSRFRCPEEMRAPAMRGVAIQDFDQPRGSLEYMWARLGCLVHRLDEVQNGSSLANFDEDVLRSYASDLERIFLKRSALEIEITNYRKIKAKNPGHDNVELKQKIERTLRQIYVLLACGARLQRDNGDIAAALHQFGFVLKREVKPGNDNLVVLACTLVTAAAFSIVQVAVWAGQLARSADVWTPSPYFPTERFEPFPWAVTLLLTYGTAIVVADRIRRRGLSSGTWFAQVGADRVPIYANYVRVGLSCGLAGFVALVLWGATFRGFSVGLAREVSPFAVLPALAGTYFAFYLDKVELNRAPSCTSAIFAQMLCVGFFAFIAADAWLSMYAQGETSHDLPVFVSLLHGAIGATLAWLVVNKAAPYIAHVTLEAEDRSMEREPRVLATSSGAVVPLR